MEYIVFNPSGVAVMTTHYEKYRYSPEVELQMLNLGYKITINGKRITKKEISDTIASKSANRKK